MSDLAGLSGRVEATVASCEESSHWAADVQRDIFRTLGDLEAIVGKAEENALFAEALSLTAMAAKSLGDVADHAQGAAPSGRRWLAEHGARV